MKNKKLPSRRGMLTLILFLLIFCSTAGLTAQNLVPNPGFEEYLSNPDAGADGVNESIAWFNLGNSTDFFHRMYGPISGIPNNFRGYQEPASGDGCAGVINWPQGPKEYMAVQLTSPLQADMIYEMGFKVNLSDACQYTSDDIGMTFSVEEPDGETIRKAVYHFKNPEGQMIRDTVGWNTLSGHYLAKGGESYLVIGNFYDDRDTDKEINSNTGAPWVYFYIDDVMVQACSDQSVEQIPTDTTICEGTTVQLSGLPDANHYYWEGIGADQSIEVEMAGSYLVNNFTGCENTQLIYTVKTPDCDCELEVPSIQLVGDPLRTTASFNVQSYQLRLFDASGRLVATTSDIDLDKLRLPQLSAIYFWQAELSCLNEMDMLFQKTVGGKLIIKNF